MKTEFFEVRLYLVGVKKKDRSVKRHGITLARVPFIEGQEIDKEAIKAEAKLKAAEVMKEITNHNKTISMVYSYTDSTKPDMLTSEPFSDFNHTFNVEL